MPKVKTAAQKAREEKAKIKLAEDLFVDAIILHVAVDSSLRVQSSGDPYWTVENCIKRFRERYNPLPKKLKNRLPVLIKKNKTLKNRDFALLRLKQAIAISA